MNHPTGTTPETAGPCSGSSSPASPIPKRLTGLELKCMKALWFEGAQTVRDVHQALKPSHPVAYTTVLTVMGRLTRKGFVARSRHGKAHVYQPQCSFEESRGQAVSDLVRSYFGGSADQLMAFLAGEPPQKETPVLSNLPDRSSSGPQLNECLL